MEGTKRMRPALNRRSFLKLGAASGALAAVGGMATTQGWLAPAQATAAPEERTAFTYHNEHCLCNCMLQCTVRDGRLVMVQPRPNSDKRFQNVCLKGISEIEHIYGEARIQSPMRRVGERGSGQFEVISWDEAFKIIAENFQATIDKYGSQALWIQYSTEASQRFSPLLASILGAQAGGLNGYDMGQGNGQGQAFGWSGMFALNTIWEWEQANVVLMANCNVLETGMMWSRAFLNAQAAGTKIIVLDPRFTATASKADQWVGLRPGTDPAFFLGMVKYLLDNDLCDREHMLAHTSFPFLVNAKTGEVLGEMHDTVDKETGKPKQVKAPYVWDSATGAAVLHDTPGAQPALEGTFTVDGVQYITEYDLLKQQMADYTLDWAEGVTGVPADTIAQVARVWRMFVGLNFVSPLAWDMIVITCYLVINVLDLVWLVRGDERKVAVLSRVALPVAILVHSVTAWIFGLQIAKAWYSAIMAPIFVASACDSGLALLLICLLALDRAKLFKFDRDLMKSLAGLLAVFVAVDAFFIGCECLTMGYPGAGEAEALAIMTTGKTAPFFWFEVIGGLAVPFLVLVFARNRENPACVVLASALIVLGVFCKRAWLLFTSFTVPNVYGGNGITLGTAAAQVGDAGDVWTTLGVYAPTLPEVVVFAGVVCAGALAYMILSKCVLPKCGGEQ